MPGRDCALALLASVVAATACGASLSAKPAVPPGRDPGGIAIALIGGGIDYTDPAIAPRLARDGEGELVGFDLIDQDRRPYAEADAVGTRMARHIIARSQAARIAVMRAASADLASIGQAVVMAASSPARIVLIDATTARMLTPGQRTAVAARLAGQLVIMATVGDGDANAANAIFVLECLREAPFPAHPTIRLAGAAGDAATGIPDRDDLAAAALTSFAARIAAREAETTPETLRAEIFAHLGLPPPMATADAAPATCINDVDAKGMAP